MREGRATAEVQSDGNGDSASSVPWEASGDVMADLDSWRLDGNEAGRLHDGLGLLHSYQCRAWSEVLVVRQSW